jgi:hypothetical protein
MRTRAEAKVLSPCLTPRASTMVTDTWRSTDDQPDARHVQDGMAASRWVVKG